MECDWVVRFLAARLWAVRCLSTALYYLHIQIFVNFVFGHDLVLVFIATALLFSSVPFKKYSHLSNSRQEERVLSQSMSVARWARPAKEHAQDVLFWWFRPGVRVQIHALFLEGPVCVQFFMPFFLVCSFFVLVVAFSQKSIYMFKVCLLTYWCFVLLRSDLKIVFKKKLFIQF